MADSLFVIDHLRVAYPSSNPQPIWAVDDVSLILSPGERLGLVGESSCGKSTLGRATMRLLPDTSQVQGEIRFEGRSVLQMNPAELRHFRGEAVALVFQDPMTRLDPLMTIGQHCIKTLKAHRPQLSTAQAKQKALETLAAVKIPANRWSQYPHEFSGGMRQRVAIALALLLEPKLIVADEPTTSLDVTIAAQILQELTRLGQERDTAILIISHDLAMVAAYCQRIAVMYRGKIVEIGPTQEIFRNPQHPYTKSLLKSALHIHLDAGAELKTSGQSLELDSGMTPEASTKVPPLKMAPDQPLLQIQNLQQHYTLDQGWMQQFLGKPPVIKAVDQVSLDLYAGEILGLVGESGCGKSTLSRTILKLVHPTAGTVTFNGTDLTALSSRAMQPYRRQIQMIFQDPNACLSAKMTVGQGIADPLLIHRLVTPQAARTQVLEMLERVGLTPAKTYYDRYPKQLSGGQQQRVAIARALITHPQLVICDEPVSMLDASIQAQVLELMLELKQEFDLTYLFITHDLWVARYLCNRIAVMNGGQIVEVGETAAIFTRPQHPYTQTLLNAAPLLTQVL
ncbi:MAG: ABC transporter ATP-binding protein [Oscillatoriales cyanobacterium RM2_1_1]|nr:ABC transporter ATP-binding protein [Oscillatoriales cyanobacterium SM2_3_0]NJO46970.1 ABC transporter ATP-binding protein [Oscillatoriales cyanobacterium RM2_1_1]